MPHDAPSKNNPFRPILEKVFCCSCSLFDRRKLDLGKKDEFVFSGTFVHAFGRFFIATAGHVIPDDPTADLDLFGVVDVQSAAQFLSWGGIDRDGIDIGYLEVTESVLRDRGNFAVDAGRAAVGHEPSENDLVVIAGSPGDSLLRQPGVVLIPNRKTMRYERSTTILRPRFDPTITWLLRHEDWPDRIASPQPDNNAHYLLRYDPETITRVVTGHKSNVLPGGYSGGGIWLIGRQCPRGSDTPSLVSPDSARLLGIQVGWYSEAKAAKAMQFRVWLDFVRESLRLA